ANPAPRLPYPHVGVASGSRLSIGLRIRRAAVDDRGIAENSDAHVFDVEIRNRTWWRNLAQEGRAIDERPIRVAGEEITGQIPIEPLHVGRPHGADEALIELPQSLRIGRLELSLLAHGVLHRRSPSRND